MILSDEEMCLEHPGDRNFDTLVLIVNCHKNEDEFDPKKYKIGSFSTSNPPKVIAHCLSAWDPSTHDIAGLCHEIQIEIWQSLQKGSVAVQCLAGIHRAACIVACQYLYRHYALGHTEIASEKMEIYR